MQRVARVPCAVSAKNVLRSCHTPKPTSDAAQPTRPLQQLQGGLDAVTPRFDKTQQTANARDALPHIRVAKQRAAVKKCIRSGFNSVASGVNVVLRGQNAGAGPTSK